MLPYVEHANLTVLDLDEAIRFITTAVPEFRIRYRGITDGTEWAHVGTDETYLAFSQASAGQPTNPPYEGPGINHVGLVVSDAGAVAASLTQAGYQEGFRAGPHPYRKRIYFHDSDGNEWEFVEYFTEDAALRNDYTS